MVAFQKEDAQERKETMKLERKITLSSLREY